MHPELETADTDRGALRRVSIDPISRVEGHGKVTLLLDEADQVREVRLHIVEFRGFERFVQGRPYWEMPVIVQRLCGICPVSHHLAASKALDQVVGARVLTPAALKLRRLMHTGQMLQSHALHFFHLSSPDLLFGFDAEIGQRNIVAVLEHHPDIARKGILLRKFGQEIIRVTAGKRVHGTGSVPGGVNRSLERDERLALLAQAPEIIGWSRDALALIRSLHRANPALYDRFASARAHWMSLVDDHGTLDFYDGSIRVSDPDGSILFDQVPCNDYSTLITEAVKPWSYMKFPYLNALGPDGGWYRVGPLARVQNADRMPTPLADAARRDLLEWTGGEPTHAALAYHWARMIEMLCAAELIADLLADPDLESGDLLARGERQREGIGIIEAPRGTLIHHYRVDDDDLVTMANLIVSTTHNNEAMNAAIRDVAREHLNGRAITEPLLNHIEVAIRAYDPCLSCATHALGSMPLEVSLIDADGALIERRVRD